MVDKRYKYNNKNRNLAGNPIHQPTEKYKEGWTRIFGKKKMKKETKHYITHGYEGVEILVPVTESEKMQDELEPTDKETEKFLDDIANNTPNSEQF
jgi:hypothetical protein|tara:strand:- start:320 stop:607 length:288 start_codon:yes stop_codon:yes gene_type:complete